MADKRELSSNANPAANEQFGGLGSSMHDGGDKSSEEDVHLVSERSANTRLESVYYSVVSHTTAGGRIVFGNKGGGEIELLHDRELPHFASAGTKAYLARDLEANIEYVVILCGRSELPRLSTIGSFRSLKSSCIMRLITAGVVNWTPEGRQRFALIFQQPVGRKVIDNMSEHPDTYSGDFLRNVVIKPTVELLRDLQNIDLVHGAIRLDNMYVSRIEGSESFMLGECLSSAPSYHQHPIYEMASRAMVSGAKRGTGTAKDDLYSLGICVAMMAKGHNFALDKTEQQLINDKLTMGSYAAIIGKDALPSGIAEFLRGVLNDDIDQRWDVDDCLKWLDGRRIPPKPTKMAILSQRPFVYKEKEYLSLRVLANAFAANISDATSELHKTFFLQWMRRNFDDKDSRDRFERIYNRDQTAVSDRYISLICSAIDPYGPVRYGGISIYPAGIGTALLEAVKAGESLQPYVEMIKEQLLNNWVNQLYESIPDATGIVSMLEKCRMSISQKARGYGVERVLYITNPGGACMSPYFDRHYVLTPSALLLALEDISIQGERPDMVLDRHMISFLSVREPNLIDQYLGLLNSSDNGKKVVGVLRVLEGIQRRFSVGPVPGISKWIGSLLQAAIDNYNDRDLRSGLSRELVKIQSTGMLTDLMSLIDNQYVVQEDQRRFSNASTEFRILNAEKNSIERNLSTGTTMERSSGRQVSMIVSSLIAFITIALYSFIYFYGKN